MRVIMCVLLYRVTTRVTIAQGSMVQHGGTLVCSGEVFLPVDGPMKCDACRREHGPGPPIGLIVLDGKMYVVGGYDGTNALGSGG